MREYQQLINAWLVCDDAVNGGRAASLWPMLLSLSHPDLEDNLSDMLLKIVMRGCRNQFTSAVDDFVEFFSGRGNLTKEMLIAGFRGSGFDVCNDASHNVLQPEGLKLFLLSLCSLKKRALVWLGTQCSSFVVLCRAQSQRYEENSFLGRGDAQFVQEGNLLADISALIYLLSWFLGLHVVLEQPSTSVMFQCPSLKGVLEFTSSYRISTYMGMFNGPTQKPLTLMSTWTAMQDLRCGRPQMDFSESLVIRHDGSHQFTGRKDSLLESQCYTRLFGQVVAEICRREWR